MLDVEKATDGVIRLTSAPNRLHVDDVDELFTSLTDPGRSAAVIIASVPPGQRTDRWMRVIDSLTKGSVGIASVHVVEEEALQTLNAALPPSHRVPQGFVRTYVSGVDVDSPEDGRRHIFLTTLRLERSITRDRVAETLQNVHAQNLRRVALTRSLPRDVRRAIELLGRDEQVLLRQDEVARRIDGAVRLDAHASPVEQIEAPPETPPIAGPELIEATSAATSMAVVRWPRRFVALLRAWAQREDETDEAVEALHRFISTQVSEKDVAIQQLEEAARREEDGAEKIAALTSRIEDLELDLAQEAEDSREHARAARIYADRLRQQHRYDDLHILGEGDEWIAPDSVSTLVDRLDPGLSNSPLLRRVVFTGDKDDAAQVDARDTVGRYAPALWQFVRVLHDYAEAKAAGFRGNVHMYLESEEAGEKCSKERHASTESSSVKANRTRRNERTFPVPTSVNESGRVLMAAHFKPTHADTFAPRLHYYDDVDRSGRVYIGYIGRHLTNTKTN